MDLTLLYFDGCPHRELAEQRIRTALAAVGRDGWPVTHVVITSARDADRLGFLGSPTIRIDGRDPFARGDEQPSLSCRMFATPDGIHPAPSVEQLVTALTDASPQ
jgi:hypothetical protein